MNAVFQFLENCHIFDKIKLVLPLRKRQLSSLIKKIEHSSVLNYDKYEL